VPDFVAEAERRMAAAGESEAWPDPVARETFRRRRIGALRAAWQTLPPGASRTWMIRAVAGTDGLTLVLLPRSGEAAQPLAARLWLGPPGQPGPAMPLRLRPGQPLEIDLAGLPGSPGGLSVRLVNDAETALVFPPEDGVRLRWRETGFAGNLARALAVIAGQLALLTALGLLLGSTLSFPVAAFCGLAYLAAAGLIGLVAQRLQHQVLFLGRQALEQPWLERVSQVALQTGYGLTAVLNSVRPVASLAEGQAIALAQVRAIGLGAGLGGSLLLLWLAGWLLRRRELGGLVA